MANSDEAPERPPPDGKKGTPTVLRADGNVQILIEAGAAQSLFEAIKAAGLIVAPPVLANYDDLVEEFGVEPVDGQSCLVVSDPDHLIADIIGRWRKSRS